MNNIFPVHLLCIMFFLNVALVIGNPNMLIIMFEKMKYMYNNNLLPLLRIEDNNEKDKDDEKDDNEKKKEKDKDNKKVEINYENKYFDLYDKCPNDFKFNEQELELEETIYKNIKHTDEINRNKKIEIITKHLNNVNDILNVDKTQETPACNYNYDLQKMLKYFDAEEEYLEYPDEVDIKEMYDCLLVQKNKLETEWNEIHDTILTDEQYHQMAREELISQKLNNYINNYVVDYTPLGIVYMRYNHIKKSFEYFSNKSIPYRYLEPMGRKYVYTYWCKPIFVNLLDELKQAEVRYNENEKKNNVNVNNVNNVNINNGNKKNIAVKFKSYNNNNKYNNPQETKPMKNRNNNSVMPPNMRANLPNVGGSSEKQLIKQNANRYTWEGRLSSFNPLKKINKKDVDKNLQMSYADFKKKICVDKNKT